MIYLLTILLGLLAAGFVLWPLVRRSNTKNAVTHTDVVRRVYRERVDELARELDDDVIRDEIENDLGAVLLAESSSAERSADDKRVKPWALLILALCVPAMGALTYLTVADPGLEQIRGAEEILALPSDDTATLNAWVRRLSMRVQAEPEDTKSLYLLGHAQLKLGEFAAAAESFGITHALVEDDLNIQIYWLQARYLAARGVLDEVSLGLAKRILDQQPNMSVVLEILALDAFRRGEAENAVNLLNRALSGTPDLRQQASFATAIAQVRQGMTNAPPGVSVKVSTEVTVVPQATVFVVARPVGGGMPFAAIRRPAFLLPFEVRLDDLVSMSPNRKLSDAEAFEVVVRLSETGNAMPSDGDWQWISSPLNDLTGVPVLDAALTPPE